MKRIFSWVQTLGVWTLLVFFPLVQTFGQAGKISGTVTDAETGEPLAGVNIVVEDTELGAASDASGYYVILNIPPGTYNLSASMIGYALVTVEDVRVQIGIPATVDIALQTSAIAGEEVQVIAERPVVEASVSQSKINIPSSTIESLPVRTIEDLLSMQAGVDGLSIRGGDATETAFMMDGMSLRDERTGRPVTTFSLSALQEVQIQTGGFSAEYGNIESGLINVVTKEGSRTAYNGALRLQYNSPSQKHFGAPLWREDSYFNRPFLDDSVAWTGTESGWDEYTRQQYPAFDGWNAVSQSLMNDDDPNNDLTPEQAQELWKWQHRRENAGRITTPDYLIDAGFGGPVPLISRSLGDLRFYASHKQENKAYLVPLTRDSYWDNFSALKVTSNITDNMKLKLNAAYSEILAVNPGGLGSGNYLESTEDVASLVGTREGTTIMYYPHARSLFNRYSHAFSLELTHTLSTNTFYELSVERSGNIYRSGPSSEVRDTSTVRVFGDNYRVDEAPYGYFPGINIGIGGELQMGDLSRARDSSNTYSTTVKLDVTSQLNRQNQLIGGMEFSYLTHDVLYGFVRPSLPLNASWESWNRNPIRGAAYLEDRIEFEGLIANIGIRLDYSDAGGQWYSVDPFNELLYSNLYSQETDDQIPKSDTKAFWELSPRLGVSHPITTNSKIYFNYGHFRRIPEATSLYRIDRDFLSERAEYIANPNAALAKTVAYELGYEHNLFDQVLLRLAAYYKDVRNHPNNVRYVNINRSVNYLTNLDNAYRDIRGFEVSFERNFGQWIYGLVNYTYDVQSSGYFGRLENYENPADQRIYDRENIYQERSLPRPSFKANIALNSPRTFGPEIQGMHPLGDWTLSFRYFWRHGGYFTWTGGRNVPGVESNAEYPPYTNADFRLAKRINVGRMALQLYAEVTNLFNVKRLSNSAFDGGADRQNYLSSLLWPEEIGEVAGTSIYGNDSYGDLRPDGVKYDPLESNPSNDPEIYARNQERIENKSYIDNPNIRSLYYLNPRDIWIGLRIYF